MNGSRAWTIALAVSVAVNVFLIGGLAGMAFVRLTAPPPASPPAPPAEAVAIAPRSTAPIAEPSAPPPEAVVETPRQAHPAATRPAPRPPAPSAAPAVSPPRAGGGVAGVAPRPPLISAGDVLSPESRQAFRRALNAANRRNRPIVQQARAERLAALAALGAPGYDPAEVGRRLEMARDLDQQARANVEAALAAFTATLSPQERAALADGLTKVYMPLGARRAALVGSN